MKRITIFLFAIILIFTGCRRSDEENTFRQITQAEAKKMMDSQDVLILDVREQDEFDTGHIPGAVLFPVGEITEGSAADVIPKSETVVLVYCRSGNRSLKAAQRLVEFGYTNVYEFGGINSWPYEVE